MATDTTSLLRRRTRGASPKVHLCSHTLTKHVSARLLHSSCSRTTNLLPSCSPALLDPCCTSLLLFLITNPDQPSAAHIQINSEAIHLLTSS
jgi:hypothetical protein